MPDLRAAELPVLPWAQVGYGSVSKVECSHSRRLFLRIIAFQLLDGEAGVEKLIGKVESKLLDGGFRDGELCARLP
jgi:hypothetical protein